MSTVSKMTSQSNFSEKFIDQMEELCLNSNSSDVTFVVDGVEMPAHKLILRLRNSHFQGMFDGGFSESSQSKIELEVPLEAFKHVLRFIYTGRMALETMDSATIIDFLGLCHQYCIEEPQLAIVSYLMENVSLEMCCDTFGAANLFNFDKLKKATLDYLDENVDEVLKMDNFKTLSNELLYSLLQRDTFCAKEIDIFRAVFEWRKYNPNVADDAFQMIVSAIRFELIDLGNLITVVRESSILSETRLLDVIRAKTIAMNLNLRVGCKLGINVATNEFNAKTIKGLEPLQLLNGNFTEYTSSNNFSYHKLYASGDDCIMVELGHIFKINRLKMLLWDRDDRLYSYYIEVSTDQKQWIRVIDRTEQKCFSWQFLYFDTQPVRYIKVVGTRNTANDFFHVVHLAAYYQNNVASLEKGAKVIQGENDDALDGNISNYTFYSGFTRHSLGKTPIVIQLAQPYHVGSVRLLLWDGDARKYSFYIETSTDQINWEMAVDKRDEQLRSWQEFSFEPRTVVFFRITGTFNSIEDNVCFHLVHFEAHSTRAERLNE